MAAEALPSLLAFSVFPGVDCAPTKLNPADENEEAMLSMSPEAGRSDNARYDKNQLISER